MMNKHRGTAYLLMTGLFFSIGGLCIKLVPWGAMATNGARCAISGLIIFLYVKFTGHKIKINKTIIRGAFAIAVTSAIYASAVKLTTAGAAIVIQFTAPIWTMLFGLLIYRKRPRRIDITASVAVLAGIAVCFYDGFAEGRTAGNLLALVSGITYSGVFLSNASEDSDSLSSFLIGQIAGGLVSLPFIIQSDFAALGTKGILAIIAMGVFQLGLGYIFLAKGLQLVPPVTACLITGIEPVLNPIWVSLFYGEKVSPLFVLGGAIVLVSVTLYEIAGSRKDKNTPLPE